MPSTRVYSRSFAGGELSPEMYGRIDDAKFQSGAAKMQNFVVTPTGTAKNRAGFAYVNSTKNNGPARLIPFTWSIGQTMVIELGAGYARFHTQGETLEYSAEQPAFQPSGVATYTVAAPTVLTWANHGLTNGQSVVLALASVGSLDPAAAYPAGLGYGPYNVQVIDADTFNLADPTSGDLIPVTAAGVDQLAVQPNYAVGALASYEGAIYYRRFVPPSAIALEPYGSGGAPVAPPGGPAHVHHFPSFPPFDSSPAVLDIAPLSFVNVPSYWYVMPADLSYEIPTPFQAADLFDIHFAQSADVMTLVHPNYPARELSRLSATAWSMVAINFGPPLATPQNVSVTASPGYLAAIASVTAGSGTQAGNALITTVANSTLAIGDGVYVQNLTYTPTGGEPQVLDGFYMVALVPADSSGNLITTELYLMNYSGYNLAFQSGGTYSSGATIQYGTQIFNIVNPYAVQAVGADGVSTSALSASASVLNNLDVPGSYNTIAWDAVANAGAVSGSPTYNVYKQLNGLWGFIGNTSSLSFADNNIAPDMSITPGTPDAVFSGAGNYPGAVCYFQQRTCFAGTINAPNNAWMSNSGTESMFSYSLPSMATDRIAFQVAALQADAIQHLMPMLELMMLTSESEFALVPVNSSAITPSSISVQPQSYIGASNVQPTIINTTMVYAAARGGHVRELGYAWTVNGYMTGDLSLRAAHLFDTFTIVDQAYAKAPWPIVWFVSSNGNLLGLTYIPEEQLGAWHHHTTEGTFQSIACVAEGTEDVLYAVITRTVNGQTVNYIERMQSRFFTELSDAFFVDAGASQAFDAPVTEISGLTWLEGATVAVLADGGVQKQKVVTGGAIALDYPASVVQVGLPYTSELETLPAVMQLDGYGQGRRKNISHAWLKVYQSSGILVGPDCEHLTEMKLRTNEPWGSPPAMKTGEYEILITPSWQADGQTTIQQVDPLPLDVVGLTLEVAIGG